MMLKTYYEVGTTYTIQKKYKTCNTNKSQIINMEIRIRTHKTMQVIDSGGVNM